MTAVTPPQRVALVIGAGSSCVTGLTAYADGGHSTLNGVVVRAA